jgi:hypothetical protein
MNTRKKTDYIFQIPFDDDAHDFGSLEIKTRLVNVGAMSSLQALPEDAIATREATGVLDMSARVVDDEIIITTKIKDDAITRSDFADIIKNTLKVALQVNLPYADGSPQGRVSTHFWVKVQQSPYLELLLSPQLQCTLEVDKRGIAFEPLPLTVKPETGFYVRTLGGTLYLPVEDPETGRITRFPLSHARVTITCATVNGDLQSRIESDDRGEFRFLLPDVDHLPAERGLDYTLDEARGEAVPARLDEEREQAVVVYEKTYAENSPLYLLPYELARNLRTYRLHWCRQLAALNSEPYETLCTSLKLMESTLEITQSFERMSRERSREALIAMEQMLSLVFEIANTLGALSGAAEKDATNLPRELNGLFRAAGNGLYARRLIESTVIPQLGKLIAGVQGSLMQSAAELPPAFTPLVDDCASALRESLQEIEDFLEAHIVTGDAAEKERISGEAVKRALTITAKAGAALGSAFFPLFSQALLVALKGFATMNEGYGGIISSSGASSFETLGTLLGIKEGSGGTGEFIRQSFAHIVQMMGEKMGEKAASLRHRADDAAQAELPVKEIADSLSSFGLLAGQVISHIHEEARNLKIRRDLQSMERLCSSLTAGMGERKGVPWDYEEGADEPLGIFSSFISSVDWYISLLGSFTSLCGAPSLMERAHTLEVLESAFKTYLAMLPCAMADLAASLHLSLIYSIAVLNLNSEEDML